MSASHIFSIMEILEQILSELPPLEIIRCQRVNSTWKQLIADSPLLRYQAWLCNDFPDPAYHVRADDLMSRAKHKGEVDYHTKRYIYNVSKHLHPVIVSNIMKNLPQDPIYSFEPLRGMDKNGFGGYFKLIPALLRDLRRWYERNKATEHVWASIPLYRPNARKVSWSLPDSGGGRIPVELEAFPGNPEEGNANYPRYAFRVKKGPGEPPVLTLGDLMSKLDCAWERWMDSEREIHFLTHYDQGCDLDQGIPSEDCLKSEDGDEEDEYGERVTFGTKMTMEEHIEQAMCVAAE